MYFKLRASVGREKRVHSSEGNEQKTKKKKNGLVLTRNEIPSEGWLSGVLIIINYLRHTLSGSLLLILAQA